MMASKIEIRPIHSAQDYADALSRVETLMEIDRTQDEDYEIDLLATLIEIYEDKHFPMDPPDPIEAIKFRMQQLEMGPSDLAAILGSRSNASEVLDGKRDLTLAMIRTLHRRLSIPAEILIRESGQRGAAAPGEQSQARIEQ